MPTTAQDRRLAELTRDHSAVAMIDLGGPVALVARDPAGAIALVEVVTPDGEVGDPDAAQDLLAQARAIAALDLKRTTDALIGLLAVRSARGDDVNLTRVAAAAGIARQTLYNRVPAQPIAEPASA